MNYLDKFKLNTKITLVTGGAGGIGKEICKALLDAKSTVILADIDEKKSNTFIKSLKKNKNKIVFYKLDATSEKNIKELKKIILKRYKKLDILINAIGVCKNKDASKVTKSEWDEVININLKGTFNCIKSILPNMIKNNSGKIINITSIVGIMGNPGQSNYCAAKAGIIGLTKSIAKEYGSRSINVNAIAPGLINTDMTNKINTEDLKKNIVLKRNGNPDDIANLVCFLCTSDASYITGQVINVDGGLLI